MAAGNRLHDSNVAVSGGLVGFIMGSALMISLFTVTTPNLLEAKVFQREQGKPAVMRTYKLGRDGLLVQDGKNERRYIPLDQYLNTIKDKSDREIEEATIRKIAGWYN